MELLHDTVWDYGYFRNIKNEENKRWITYSEIFPPTRYTQRDWNQFLMTEINKCTSLMTGGDYGLSYKISASENLEHAVFTSLLIYKNQDMNKHITLDFKCKEKDSIYIYCNNKKCRIKVINCP